MSFTKKTINQIIDAVSKIQKETIEDNDLTEILNALNVIIAVGENISKKDQAIEFYWNEIISEYISVVYSSISGNTRLGIAGLRNILELVCHSFFYVDHKIELSLFVNENIKADKYVSTLVNEYMFFTTKYIKTFYLNIDNIQRTDDSVSNYLKELYSSLCDVVHGRYKTLTKTNHLKIEYSKEYFKKFEGLFLRVSSIISIMYILRFNDFSDNSILDCAKKTNPLNL